MPRIAAIHQEGKGQTAHTIETQAVTANPREKGNEMEKQKGEDVVFSLRIDEAVVARFKDYAFISKVTHKKAMQTIITEYLDGRGLDEGTRRVLERFEREVHEGGLPQHDTHERAEKVDGRERYSDVRRRSQGRGRDSRRYGARRIIRRVRHVASMGRWERAQIPSESWQEGRSRHRAGQGRELPASRAHVRMARKQLGKGNEMTETTALLRALNCELAAVCTMLAALCETNRE